MSGGAPFKLLVGGALERLGELAAGSVQTCVTSPPYWGLRDYGVEGQIGLEPTPAEFIKQLVAIFREVHRVLRPDGTLWVNMGDTYASELARRCIVAGSDFGDLVLDPFAGTCTTAVVALREGRRAVCVELNPTYAEMGERRVRGVTPSLFTLHRRDTP